MMETSLKKTERFDLDLLQVQLVKNSEEKSYELKSIIGSHGLNKDEPLTFIGIIRAAFANPERAKYPDFCNLYQWGYKFCHQVKADTLVERIKTQIPKSGTKFNIEQIRAHDVSKLFEESQSGDYYGQKVDPSAFLETIKKSRWYGPYVYDENSFAFFSIDNNGNKNYNLRFGVFLRLNYDPRLTFSFYKKDAFIRNVYSFDNS